MVVVVVVEEAVTARESDTVRAMAETLGEVEIEKMADTGVVVMRVCLKRSQSHRVAQLTDC